MLSMHWASLLMAGTALLSTFALYVALSTSARCRSSPPSVPLTRLATLEERQDIVESGLKNLRSRLSMMDLRARRSTPQSETPETELDPDSPIRPSSELASADEKAEIRRRLNAATLKR